MPPSPTLPPSQYLPPSTGIGYAPSTGSEHFGALLPTVISGTSHRKSCRLPVGVYRFFFSFRYCFLFFHFFYFYLFLAPKFLPVLPIEATGGGEYRKTCPADVIPPTRMLIFAVYCATVQ